MRLTEMPRDGSHPATPPFWLEIHSHASRSTIDGCGCFEFDEDELATCVDLVRFASSCATARRAATPRSRRGPLHDGLTALPTRALFLKRLEEALRHPARASWKAGLLLLDLDGFREINAALGYDAEDAVLRMVADRLRVSARPGDVVARHGSDEFAVLLPDLRDRQDLEAAGTAILSRMREPLACGGQPLECWPSIGASLWPDHAVEASDLLRQADLALGSAKAAGGTFMVFEPVMGRAARRRAAMLDRARDALHTGRIEPFYQPKIELRTGRVAGLEALLRWRNGHGRTERPAGIRAAFDDPRLMAAISRRMHDLVFAGIRRWLDGGLAFGRVAINVAAAEFHQDDFAERILARLQAAGIPTSCIEVEVTETVFLGACAGSVERALLTLHREGITIALDDFGTGYASLSHLRRLPVDVIKIDKSFLHDPGRNGDDPAILEAILGLGQRLGLTTVAEGVETEAQATYLRCRGCDLAQGYLFSEPVPGSQVPDLVSGPLAYRDKRTGR